MHNAAFAAGGLDAVYVPLPAADFDDFLTFARAVALAGASVTIPFKGDALRAAGAVDDLARRVGAANTLRRRETGWEATNTDVGGFLEPLDRAAAAPVSGMRVSVLGAGGAARAVIVALQSRGARVTVHARRPAQADEVAISLGISSGPWPPAVGSWDMLVNCTPLGGATAPESSPLPRIIRRWRCLRPHLRGV
jgi:shikimate dehydrogenase